MHAYTSFLEAFLRLGVALLFAAIVGWERESRGRAAGLRTHLLVALGAAGFTLVGLELAEAAATERDVTIDPLRVISGIVGGVGFLGAGAIIQSRGEVYGLTTAAGLWVVAAVGVAAGAGLYEIATAMSVFAIITLAILRPIEKRLVKRYGQTTDGPKEPGSEAGESKRGDSL